MLFWAGNQGNHQNGVPLIIPHEYLNDLNANDRDIVSRNKILKNLPIRKHCQ